MECSSLQLYFGELFIGNPDASPVEVGIQLRLDPQSLLRRRAADQVDDDGSRAKRLATPVLRDVAKHAVLDLVPLARARREMADRDPQAQVVRQTLQHHFPQPWPIAVAAPGIGGDQEPAGSRIDQRPHLFPPAPDTHTGELGGVVVDANADPALVAAQIIDSLGDRLTQPLVRKVLGTDLLRPATAMPLPPGIAKIPDVFLLLGVD